VLAAGSTWPQATEEEEAVFTYQGQLKDAGVPANGFYDLMFSLYDVETGGQPIPVGASTSLLLPHEEVENGLFTVRLDFGADVFQEHDELWLEVAVRPYAAFGAPFTTLSPRQPIDATPRAIVAQYAERTKGGTLAFGDVGLTSLGIDPDLPGLTAMDPMGMRVRTMKSPGQCSLSGESCMLDEHCPSGETCEPCETCEPLPTRSGSLYLGGGNSSIGIRENLSGILVNDVGGLRLVAGAHVCSEEYLTYPEVKYCEADSDCYGCCTPVGHCSISGTLCETTEDCQTGYCTDSGNDCNTVFDCAPGRCRNSLAPCYTDGMCMGSGADSCTDPRPEGCVGGETCVADWACSRHCQSDADCPDEGSFCDSPVPSDCISPEGRCSGNNFACYADTDCPAGYCAEAPDRACWTDIDCLVCGGWSCTATGPCVGAESCQQPILGRLGQTLAFRFGETDDHAFGFDPGLQRLVAVDPLGLSLVSPGTTCSGSGEPCESDADCPPGGCADTGYPCRTDADCFGATAGTCTNPPPQTCESNANGLRVFFGSDDDTSIGTDPALAGLVLRSADGTRLLAPSPLGGPPASAKLFFGESLAGPFIGDDPVDGSLLVGSHRDIIVFDPQPEPPGKLRLRFGLTEETSIGTDPDAAGLILSDPSGVRLLNSMDPSENALIFGLGGARGTPEARIDTGVVSDGMRFYAPSFFFDGGPVGVGTSSPGRPLQIGSTAILNSQGMIRLASRSGTLGTSRMWDIGVPQTDPDGFGLSFVIDDISLGTEPEFMVKWGSGNVGIGTSAPHAKLEVKGGDPFGVLAVGTFDRTVSDGMILDFRRDGSSVGSVSVVHGVVSYNTFTGSHLASSDARLDRGDLVRLTGVNSHLRRDAASEIVYGIAPSTRANDPRCLGAYLGEYSAGESDGDTGTHLVMANGNGEMWVVDAGDDLEPGDYLISSDVAGCAMKDDVRRFPVGYVVARAAEGVQWSDVHPDEHGVRKARISVFFESFVRGSDASHLAVEVARLTEVIEAQRSAIEALERRLATWQPLTEEPSRHEKTNVLEAGSGSADLGGTR
jgi:hypothetical protein